MLDMFYLNVCRSQTRQRVPDKQTQSNYLTPRGGGLKQAEQRVESSTAQYELTYSDLADDTQEKSSEYAGLKEEPEYLNTANVYSDLV